MSRQTEQGDTYQAGIGNHVSYFWAGESTGNAPLASDSLPTGCLGAASVASSTAGLYVWTGSAWVPTGGTLASFYGGST